MTKLSILLRNDSDKPSRTIEIHVPPLVSIFERLGDWRKRRGRVYQLAALLIVMLAGLMCGKRGLRPISRWCRKLPRRIRTAMGLRPGRSPSHPMLSRLLRNLDRDELEREIRLWLEVVNEQLAQMGIRLRIAIDGKTLRGAVKRGAEVEQLLAAVSQQLPLVLAEIAVAKGSNEITAILPLLKQLVLEGRLVTVDALLTQREVAQAIMDGGGDYLMYAKDNQPQLRQDIAWCFESVPLAGEVRGQARLENKKHGRWEVREIVTSSALKEYLDWPGVEQVMQVTRTVTILKTGQTTKKTVYALTSLPAACADPLQLLRANRGHWIIENGVHWVRDVTLGEDACGVHTGTAPQVFAALRNLMLSLFRLIGYTSIAAAIDFCSAQPALALRSMGVSIGP